MQACHDRIDTAGVGTIDDDIGTDMLLGNTAAKNGTYDGKEYMFRVYPDIALTAGQVSILFKGGKFPSMTAYWNFHEGEGIVLHDIKNNNDGEIDGAIWVDAER